MTELIYQSSYTGAEIDEAVASIVALLVKVPQEASGNNQLADKAFVNSSIATNTANYISNNGQPFTSVEQLQSYAGTVTHNDYAFVTGVDEYGNTYFDRYKASVNGSTVTWAKEYRLNNSSFTAAQWSAISSGITASLVSDLNANTAARHTHSNISTLELITGSDQIRKITISTSQPSGGSNGDIWLQYAE